MVIPEPLQNIQIGVAAIPEPATWVMMILGFLGMGSMGYRRRRSKKLNHYAAIKFAPT